MPNIFCLKKLYFTRNNIESDKCCNFWKNYFCVLHLIRIYVQRTMLENIKKRLSFHPKDQVVHLKCEANNKFRSKKNRINFKPNKNRIKSPQNDNSGNRLSFNLVTFINFIVMLFSVAGCIWQSASLLKLFFNYPTTLMMYEEKMDKFVVPGLTVCPTSRYWFSIDLALN